jgi:hypothetical protein
MPSLLVRMREGAPVRGSAYTSAQAGKNVLGMFVGTSSEARASRRPNSIKNKNLYI